MERKYLKNTDSNSSGIYKIFCKENWKCYIGSTKNSFNERIYKHLYELKRGNHANCHLQASFDKHGIDSFVVFGLEKVSEIDRLQEREQHWIDFHEDRDAPLYNFVRNLENNVADSLLRRNDGAGWDQSYKLKYEGTLIRDPEGTIHEIEGSVTDFCKDLEVTLENFYSLLSGDQRYHKMWTDPTELLKPNEYRQIYNYWEAKNINNGERVHGETTRELADQIGSCNTSIFDITTKEGHVYKNTWTGTDKVHPDLTYQDIKKQHEQLTSN